jgi:clan AA aspartic protease
MSTVAPEHEKMGRVTTAATIENLGDLFDVSKGRLTDDQVRRVTVEQALVDTGASTLSLPSSLIKQLGLTKVSTRRITTAAGQSHADRYSAVRLKIEERDATVEVMEVPDGVPVLIGQIPLEYMDFVVDPANQRLIGNPAHGGEWIMEMY